MVRLKQGVKKYIVLFPLLLLILNSFYFKDATQEIQRILRDEKYNSIVTSVNILASAAEANPERIWQDHEKNIIGSVEVLDQLPEIYAGVYKPIDGDNVLISERFYETTPFEPFNYDEFSNAVANQKSGHLVLRYMAENQRPTRLLIYFKWMPLYSPPDERYLVVTGVSRYSVTGAVSLSVSIGQWASTLITFIVNAWMIILYIRLGNICKRKNCDEWRNGWKWRKGVGEYDQL